MDKNRQIPIGDLPTDKNELTVPTVDVVMQRAHEIALIHERNPDKFTKEDWEQASGKLSELVWRSFALRCDVMCARKSLH